MQAGAGLAATLVEATWPRQRRRGWVEGRDRQLQAAIGRGPGYKKRAAGGDQTANEVLGQLQARSSANDAWLD